MKITLIGFGPFGQALAKIMFDANPELTLGVADVSFEIIAGALQQNFTDEHTQIVPLCASQDKNSYLEYLAGSDVCIIAVGSKYTTSILQDIAGVVKEKVCIINVAKGFSPDGNLFSEVCVDILGDHAQYCMLSGGMGAYDVMDAKITGASVGTSSMEVGEIIHGLFKSELLQTELLLDVTGVEYAGIIKNILSIKAGYLEDEGVQSIDTCIAQVTKNIKEQASLLGVDPDTFDASYCRNDPEYGDIKTSCYGGTRNFKLGQLWKKCGSLQQATQEFEEKKITVEGINSLRILKQKADHPLLRLGIVQELLKEF